MPGHWPGYGTDWMGPMHVGMVIAWLVWTLLGLGLLAALAIGLVRWWRQTGASGGMAVAETPIDILMRRYANGEIDKADFEARLADLRAAQQRRAG